MIDENEFFRNATLRICGHLEIEVGLQACIAYLSQYMPADTFYLERYEKNLGAMRIVARARAEKGERMDSNFLGLPKEGFAFSNDAFRMGPLRFDDCAVDLWRGRPSRARVHEVFAVVFATGLRSYWPRPTTLFRQGWNDV